MGDILKRPFNINQHKMAFQDTYLEVLISPQGEVIYAVPSHQEKLIRLACAKTGKTRDELMKVTPKAYYADMICWLSRITGYIAVWGTFVDGYVNRKQYKKLTELAVHGLYKGRKYISVFAPVEINTLGWVDKLEVYKECPTNVPKEIRVLELAIQEDDIIKRVYTKEGEVARYLIRNVTHDMIKSTPPNNIYE